MSLIRYEPLREFDDLFRQFSPLLRRRGAEQEWTPSANISETDKEYLIKADLPEVNKNDVSITLDSGVLTIRGERKQQKEVKEQNDIRVESFYGTFVRSFSLPDDIEADGVRAESKDGVLKVRIPKKTSNKSKSINVQVQ
jgi:HSP20 family protein